MRKLIKLSLFAIALTLGTMGIAPGAISTAYAFPPSPCGWDGL